MASTARLDPADVRRTLREAGLRAAPLAQPELPRRRRRPRGGSSPRRLRCPGGAVLEIGPGLGILTGGAPRRRRRRHRDRARHRAGGPPPRPVRRADRPGRRRPGWPGAPGALTLIEGDALDEPLTRLCPAPYDVVANLPYHITSPILHRLLGEPPRPERLVLMVQREVAERIAAPPGKMSYLSVFVQYHAAVRLALRVPPAAFEPAPEVDSAVIVVSPFPADDRLDPAAEERALAARPGRLPRAPQDDPQRAGPSARRCPPSGSPRRSPRPGSRPTGGPQTLAVGEWLRLLETLGRSPGRSRPDRRRHGRRRPMSRVRHAPIRPAA